MVIIPLSETYLIKVPKYLIFGIMYHNILDIVFCTLLCRGTKIEILGNNKRLLMLSDVKTTKSGKHYIFTTYL